ncbi:hypothetical protein AB835_11215 [Candidatus Endobugula sertula]|uniref:Uncharacterized protein n=1 Tax=Candidatus Endobugula sertula TaxID=62101 RepID=A0A1D2QN54_9GAMM|nr:hypothetical protein AB835_11215 [Candidatus Endobugula sertula]
MYTKILDHNHIEKYIASITTQLNLTSEDFIRVGKAIGKLNIPTVFVFEEGYAVDELGINTTNVLQGYANVC